jgi:hypothetical protein
MTSTWERPRENGHVRQGRREEYIVLSTQELSSIPFQYELHLTGSSRRARIYVTYASLTTFLLSLDCHEVRFDGATKILRHNITIVDLSLLIL